MIFINRSRRTGLPQQRVHHMDTRAANQANFIRRRVLQLDLQQIRPLSFVHLRNRQHQVTHRRFVRNSQMNVSLPARTLDRITRHMVANVHHNGHILRQHIRHNQLRIYLSGDRRIHHTNFRPMNFYVRHSKTSARELINLIMALDMGLRLVLQRLSGHILRPRF